MPKHLYLYAQKTMGRIFCIGETVYDIIFEGTQPVAARPGGSMLNSAVSMGRMQLPVYFISEYGYDIPGMHIDQFLKDNGVKTDYVYHYPEGKTSIALAFLDSNRNASYAFYKELPAKGLAIETPTFTPDDYVLFGSFYAINHEVRSKILPIIKSAREAGSTLIYDPNFRKAHLHELPQLMPMVIENMQLASLVKASDEDMQLIFGTTRFDESYQKVACYCPKLIYTQSNKDVIFKNSRFEIRVPAQKIEPVSTIGAGDSFSAGLLYYIFSRGIRHTHLELIDESKAIKLVQTGIDFATNVCMSYDNYIAHDFAREYRAKN